MVCGIGIGLYSRLLFVFVALCAAVTSPVARLSHAAGARAITAQEENGVKRSTWRPSQDPYVPSRRHRLFTAGPPPAHHETGRQKGTPRRASDMDSLIADPASNPIGASLLTDQATGDPGGLGNRARYLQSRVVRQPRWQAAAKRRFFPHAEATNRHAGDLPAGGASGRRSAAANEISAVRQVGQSGHLLGGFPSVRKAEGSSAVSSFHQRTVLSSSGNSNTARIEAYGQEEGRQNKSPLHARRTDYTPTSPKTVLQPLSPQTGGFLKRISEPKSPRTRSSTKSHPTAERKSKPVVPIPNSSQHALRKSQSYLFNSPQTSSVRRDKQSDDERKSLSGQSISSTTLRRDTSPSLKSHSKPPSIVNQLQPSNPESSSRDAQRPLNKAYRPLRLVKVAQKFSDSDKHYVKSLPASTQIGRSMLDYKPWRPKTFNGPAGSTSSIQMPVEERHEEQSTISSIGSNKSRPKADLQRYSLDKTMDYRIGTNNSRKYGFGQREVLTSQPRAKMEMKSQDYSEPNAVGLHRANHAVGTGSMSSQLFPNSGARRLSKMSADVHRFLEQQDKSKALRFPDTPLDTNAIALATPSEFKMDFTNVQPTLIEGNDNKGYEPDLKEYRNQKGALGLRGSNNAPHRNSSSKLIEGAKASDIYASGIDKHGSLKQPKSVKINRWFKPFSSESARGYSASSVLEESDIPELDGENIEAELKPKLDPFQSVPDHNRLLENEAMPDKSSSSQVALTPGYSSLIPRSSFTLGEGAASPSKDDSSSAYEMLEGLPRRVSFLHPFGGAVHETVRESVFSSKTRLQNCCPGSDPDKAPPTETEQPPGNATFTRSLDDRLETPPATAGKALERPRLRFNHRRQTTTLAAQPSAASTEAGIRSSYTLQNLTSPLASTGNSLADARSAGLRLDAEPFPGISNLLWNLRPTSVMAKGKRVKGKQLKGKNPAVATNGTSNGSELVPVVWLPKKLSKLEAIMYADVVGSASFSGVHAKRQRGKTSARWRIFDNDTRQEPGRGAQRERVATTSDPLGDTKGRRGGPAGSWAAALPDTSEEEHAEGEELQELNYLKTSAGNASFKSAKLSQADKTAYRTTQT